MNKAFNQILLAKEQHYLIQQQTHQKYHQPLITFNLNIPGSTKQAKIYHDFFEKQKNNLLFLLEENAISYQIIAQKNDKAGNFLILTLAKNYDCKHLKKLLVAKEQTNPSYQLVDIDVFDKDNNKISRTELNYPLKQCYLCLLPAKICAIEKTHDVGDLLAHINKLVGSI